MSSELVAWFQWFFPYMYNVFYSVKMPGTNIRLIYFFILFSLMVLVINLVRRMLYQPNSGRERFSSRSHKE